MLLLVLRLSVIVVVLEVERVSVSVRVDVLTLDELLLSTDEEVSERVLDGVTLMAVALDVVSGEAGLELEAAVDA